MTYQIINDVLVQLDIANNQTQEGLYVPKFDTFSADDGRLKTRISDNIYGTTGVVIQVGTTYNGSLSSGDRVIISNPSISKFHFNVDNATHFTGLVKVPESLIDAKIIQD